MKFSTRTRYGIRAMLEIALDTSRHGVLQKDIAVNQDISVKYLDFIIHSLKVAGLITNANGRKSGYLLTRHPAKISMYDIHIAFEHGICIVDCLSKNTKCPRGKKCAVRKYWTELNSMVIGYLKKTTLADLVDQEHKLSPLL
jgi:Rrf2 family protein